MSGTTTEHWTFPIHLQRKDGAPPADTDLEAMLTASLEQIPGFQRVEKHSGADRGIFLAHFEPAGRKRQEIEDSIRAGGFTLQQPMPDQDIQAVSTPG